MAATPLDLQVMISNIDKVAQDVHARGEGARLHKVMEDAAHQRAHDEKVLLVQETESEEAGLTALKDGRGNSEGDAHDKKKKEDAENPEHKKLPSFIDPNIGHFIDISG